MPSTPSQACLALTLCSIGSAQVEAVAPERYVFAAGQMIRYAGATKSRASYGETRSTVEWTFCVHRQNADDSFRIYALRSSKRERVLKSGQKMDFPASHSWGWFDMKPDGSFASNRSIALGLDPSVIFQPLAPTHELQDSGWRRTVPIFDRCYTTRLTGGNLIAKIDSPSHRNYQRCERIEASFDSARGLPRRVVVTSEASWSSRSTSETTLELQPVDPDGLAWPASANVANAAAVEWQPATDLDRYFASKRRYDELTFRGRTDIENKAELLATALATVRKARSEIAWPVAVQLLDKIIAGHDARIRYVDSYAKRFAPVMNQPSQDWTAKTLAGEPRSLADYRGKVVVLDFWYRGCGWCVRAMPQMNELHDYYHGKPVAILGVNKDKNLDDANFTVKAVDLRYDNLHSMTMPELYGVRGYPTLVVIDKRGVVRDIHIGYSPTLKAELIEVIDELLGS